MWKVINFKKFWKNMNISFLCSFCQSTKCIGEQENVFISNTTLFSLEHIWFLRSVQFTYVHIYYICKCVEFTWLCKKAQRIPNIYFHTIHQGILEVLSNNQYIISLIVLWLCNKKFWDEVTSMGLKVSIGIVLELLIGFM